MRKAFLLSVLALLAGLGPASAQSKADLVKRGDYLVNTVLTCGNCHTPKTPKGADIMAKAFSGGLRFNEPPFDVTAANITPDKETGIGAWSAADFDDAVRHGRRPDGSNLYPVFPYPAYTRMKPEDVAAIRAYLYSRPPVSHKNKPHDLSVPFSWRWTVTVWKWLYFEPKTFEPDPARSAQWNRGAYLTRALAHCGQCHTPRTFLGGLDSSLDMAGTPDGPDGELVPNITSDSETGIGRWTEDDIVQLLKTGFKPDYDDVQGAMYEAITFGLKYLTDADLRAISVYIHALPAISHKVERNP
jgi:mono/diheme cytochrome c family protein